MAKKEIPIKILKIIAIVSFLIINGIQENGTINFGLILMYFFAFFHDITHFPSFGIFWEGVITIPIIGTLITFSLCRKYKDRYLLLFCFIALLAIIPLLTGILDPHNYKRISLDFIIPTSIFIISSIILIVLNFRKPTKKDNLEK
ncbi:hypothetical protein [Halpernia humi]|uniref:hypothetical protein n=1 Tax=Halpernia humi TaxID=493375 RepID=UPI0011AFEB00|nr:hypothetical protein [Halpernia humi]